MNIPHTIGTFDNLPRKDYEIKFEVGSYNPSVYIGTILVTEITFNNFLELFEGVTFSGGRSSVNLLLFIENEFNEVELVKKNSKKHKEVLKTYQKIKEVNIFDKIRFLSSNKIYEGIYLGKGSYHSQNNLLAVKLDNNKLFLSRKIDQIEILFHENDFELDEDNIDKLIYTEYGYAWESPVENYSLDYYKQK